MYHAWPGESFVSVYGGGGLWDGQVSATIRLNGRAVVGSTLNLQEGKDVSGLEITLSDRRDPRTR